MGSFFGNIDDQSIESMNIIGHSWIYGFFIIGACLLLASVLVSWQVRRIQRILARDKHEDCTPAASGRETPPQNLPQD
ncbi:MAG TPA: hypothetical protein VME69_03930 [Methylocella sp.]|nr:hypothetical protein [Methylocella sp.]